MWIGEGAFISKGVKIGDGAIVGAKAVVTKDVNPYEVVAGTPAKPIRKRFDDEIISRLLALQWWNYDIAPLAKKIDYSNIGKALDLLEKSRDSGAIKRLREISSSY